MEYYEEIDYHALYQDTMDFAELMLEAEEDLDEFIEHHKLEKSKVESEADIYRAELKLCENKKDIKKFMKHFGWSSTR